MSFKVFTKNVPAVSSTVEIRSKGFSVQVAEAPDYFNITEAVQFSFNNEQGEKQPISQGSIYNFDNQEFERIILHGNAEFEGTPITFLVSNECKESEFVLPQTKPPRLKATINKATTDTVASFTDLELVNSAGLLPVAGTIQPEGDDVYFAFDVNPDVSAGLGFRLTETQTLRIEGTAFLQALRFINFTSATEVTLNLQLEY